MSLSFGESVCDNGADCVLWGDAATKQGNLHKAEEYYSLGCKFGSRVSCESLKDLSVSKVPSCFKGNSKRKKCLNEAKDLRIQGKPYEALTIQDFLCAKENAEACFDKAITLKKLGDIKEARKSYSQACDLGHQASCMTIQALISEDRAEAANKHQAGILKIEKDRDEREERRQKSEDIRKAAESLGDSFKQNKRTTTECRRGIKGSFSCESQEH